MTANSPAPPTRRLRWAAMESLGFFDAPTSATVTYRPPVESVPAITTNGPIGNGELVRELWDSTEFHASALVDWAPTTVDRKRLRGRDYRWSRILLSMLVVTASGLGAAWLARRPAENAAASAATVVEQAAAMRTALSGLETVLGQIGADEPVPGEAAAALAEVDEAARGLFEASAALPGSEADPRSTAADAAALSLDTSRRLRDAIALRGAMEALLVPPALEVDPALIELADATLAFSEWRSQLESTLGDLPLENAPDVGAALEVFIASLDRSQSGYLDGIRARDRAMALTAVLDLESGLAIVGESMMSNMESVTGEVSQAVDDVRLLIDQLVG